jgi:hypothetical protein
LVNSIWFGSIGALGPRGGLYPWPKFHRTSLLGLWGKGGLGSTFSCKAFSKHRSRYAPQAIRRGPNKCREKSGRRLGTPQSPILFAKYLVNVAVNNLTTFASISNHGSWQIVGKYLRMWRLNKIAQHPQLLLLPVDNSSKRDTKWFHSISQLYEITSRGDSKHSRSNPRTPLEQRSQPYRVREHASPQGIADVFNKNHMWCYQRGRCSAQWENLLESCYNDVLS